MKLKPSTAAATARPGKSTRWGESNRCERASFSMAPNWVRCGNAQAEERESSLSQDDAGHADGGLHQDRLHDVGRMWRKKMRSPMRPARAPRQRFAFADGHHLGANQSRVAGPSTNGQRQHQIDEARAEESRERDGQQNSGQRLKGVHGEGGERGVNPSAQVAGKGRRWRGPSPARC